MEIVFFTLVSYQDTLVPAHTDRKLHSDILPYYVAVTDMIYTTRSFKRNQLLCHAGEFYEIGAHGRL